MPEKEFQRLLENAKTAYTQSELGSHSWSHIQRVLRQCRKIGGKKKADSAILLPACVLHDLGRNGKKTSHAPPTAKARKILEKSGYPKKAIPQILSCIQSHSLDSASEPVSLEEKILFDCDKLDSLGATGAARFFMLAGENHWSLEKAVQKAFERIQKMGQRNGFYSEEGKKAGHSKALFSFLFYYLLFSELDEQPKTRELERTLAGRTGKLRQKLFTGIAKKLFG